MLIPVELAFRCYTRALYVCWWLQQGGLNLSRILMMQKVLTYLNLILISWNQSGEMFSYKNYFWSNKLTEIRDVDDYMRLIIWVNCTAKNEGKWDLCSQSRKIIKLATWNETVSKVKKIPPSTPFFAHPLPTSPYFLLTPGVLICLLPCSIFPPWKWTGNIYYVGYSFLISFQQWHGHSDNHHWLS